MSAPLAAHWEGTSWTSWQARPSQTEPAYRSHGRAHGAHLQYRRAGLGRRPLSPTRSLARPLGSEFVPSGGQSLERPRTGVGNEGEANRQGEPPADAHRTRTSLNRAAVNAPKSNHAWTSQLCRGATGQDCNKRTMQLHVFDDTNGSKLKVPGCYSKSLAIRSKTTMNLPRQSWHRPISRSRLCQSLADGCKAVARLHACCA